MPELIFLQPDGNHRKVDAKSGVSIMHAAIMANIRGIEAECGGACACATCHVYISPPPGLSLPAPSEDETEMLENVAAERKSTSRLACQITLDDTMNGLSITIPDRQF